MNSALEKFLHFINSGEISDDAWGDVFYENTSEIYGNVRKEIDLEDIFNRIDSNRCERFIVTILGYTEEPEIDFMEKIFENLNENDKQVAASYLSDTNISNGFRDKIILYLEGRQSKLAKKIMEDYKT